MFINQQHINQLKEQIQMFEGPLTEGEQLKLPLEKQTFTRQELINYLEDVYAKTAGSYNDYGKTDDDFQQAAAKWVAQYMKDVVKESFVTEDSLVNKNTEKPKPITIKDIEDIIRYHVSASIGYEGPSEPAAYIDGQLDAAMEIYGLIEKTFNLKETSKKTFIKEEEEMSYEQLQKLGQLAYNHIFKKENNGIEVLNKNEDTTGGIDTMLSRIHSVFNEEDLPESETIEVEEQYKLRYNEIEFTFGIFNERTYRFEYERDWGETAEAFGEWDIKKMTIDSNEVKEYYVNDEPVEIQK